MTKWLCYSIAIIIIVGAIILSVKMGQSANSMRNKNLRTEEENNLQFFNMNLPSSTTDASKLVLSCPDWPLKKPKRDDNLGSLPQHNQAVINELVGEKPQTFKIEILRAYFDVFDPWGQCSPEPNDLIAETCEKDAANNQGMCTNLVKTIETENSLSSQWYRNQICGSRYQTAHGYGGEANNKQGNNTEPYGGSDYVCRLQDATPFLATRCNGEKECTINLKNSDDVSQVFGSIPCYNATSGNPLKIGDDDYKRLPSNKKNNNTSFQQGYVVRGIYRCVPESE